MEYIIPVLSAYVSLYLPFNDIGTKISCSMAISQFLIIIIKYFGEKCFPKIKNYFVSPDVYVIIDGSNPIYKLLLEHFYMKYINEIKGCYIQIEHGKYTMFIKELSTSYLTDIYKENKIKISFCKSEQIVQKNEQTETKITDCDIKLSTDTNMGILEEYISNVVLKIEKNLTETKHRQLKIYKIYKYGHNKNSELKWEGMEYLTNKNMKNTIVSDDVRELLFDDFHHFITNEDYYTKHGIPYKRGYLLHGEPGTGKSSIIKVLANTYNLPIFIVDGRSFESNQDFIRIMDDIHGFVLNQKHIVVFEDIDRSIFCSRNYGYISEDCFLNILDGIDEHYGRITFLTTNYLDAVESIPSLIRPGRIDVSINITYCTLSQIKQILQLYFEDNMQSDCILSPNIIISPAILLQIINYVKDYTTVVKFLNSQVDFKKFNLERNILKLKQIDRDDKVVVEGCVMEINDDMTTEQFKQKPSLDMREQRIKVKETRLKLKQIQVDDLEKQLDRMTKRQQLEFEKKKLQLQKMKLDIESNQIEALEQKYKYEKRDLIENIGDDDIKHLIRPRRRRRYGL